MSLKKSKTTTAAWILLFAVFVFVLASNNERLITTTSPFISLSFFVLLIISIKNYAMKIIWRKNNEKEIFSPKIFAPEFFLTDAIISKKDSYRIASLDFETNGLTIDKSVLSVGCLIYQVTWHQDTYATFEEESRYERFYFSSEGYNTEATKINGLTEKQIKKNRKGKIYPKIFNNDKNALFSFLEGCDMIIGYNLKFDLSFIPEIKYLGIPFYCVMGKQRIGLAEKAEREGISFNRGHVHNALFDAELTARIYEVQLRDWWRARKSMGRSDA